MKDTNISVFLTAMKDYALEYMKANYASVNL